MPAARVVTQEKTLPALEAAHIEHPVDRLEDVQIGYGEACAGS